MTDAKHASARRAQLTIAADATAIGEHGTAAIGRWIKALPDTDVVELGANVRGDLRAFTARAVADVPVLFPQLDALLAGAGNPDDERRRLETLGKALAPRRLGTWITASDTGLDAGWTFHGDFLVATLLPHLPATTATKAFAAWTRDHGVASCTTLGRSLGADHPFTEVTVAMPRPEAVGALLAAVGASIAGDTTRVQAARVAFTATGVAHVALRFATPERSTLLLLMEERNDAALATIDAALAEDGPVAIERVATTAGPTLEIVYAVEALTDDD